MSKDRYLIEELCGLSGFTRRTVRYYVQEGLIAPPAGRGRGGYYSEVQVAQLARIRELQEQGFRLDAIRGLLGGHAPATAVIDKPPAANGTVAEAGIPRGGSWTRHAVAPGVELHVSADAEAKLGPAVAAALEAVRSIIGREGGLNE